MAGQILSRLEKNKSQWQYFAAFAKEKGFASNVGFVTDKVANDKIYHAFFSKTPRVRLKNIEAYANQAQRIYMDRLDIGAKKGMKASEADAFATNSDIYEKIMELAQRKVLEYIETKLYSGYRKSTYYENYVGTQVCGSSLTGQLKFPAGAADDLAHAKVSLLFGKKSIALSAAERAIKYKMSKAKPRAGEKPMKPADLVKSLEKIKIDVGP